MDYLSNININRNQITSYLHHILIISIIFHTFFNIIYLLFNKNMYIIQYFLFCLFLNF